MESAAANRTAHNTNVNQAPEDQHGPGYDNDCSGWVRGARGEPTGNNETAEGKPSFDRASPIGALTRATTGAAATTRQLSENPDQIPLNR